MAQNLKYYIDMEPQSKWQIVTVHPPASNELLHVQEVGDFYSGPEYYTMREGLDSFLIKLTLAGSGVLNYGGQQYALRPGSFFWLNCQQPQHYYTDPQCGNWHVIWVHFWGGTSHTYYEIFQSLTHNSPVGHLSPGSNVEEILQELVCLYVPDNSTLMTDVRASALLSSLLASCISDVSANTACDTAPPVIAEIKTHLRKSFSEHITLDGLSTQFAVSKYHLQRLFKRYTGQSPAEFLLAVRMNKAKELLRTTALPINEVAYRVGMENASHFIYTFRQQVGTTPQRYRSTWASNA